MPYMPRQLFPQEKASARNSPTDKTANATLNVNFDFAAERAKAAFVLRSCRNDPNYVPTDEEIGEMVCFEYRQVRRESRVMSGEKRERDEAHATEVTSSNLRGANPLYLAVAHNTVEARLELFDRSIDEIYQKTIFSRTGSFRDDHVVARHSALAHDALKLSGRLLLKANKDPQMNRDWCEEAVDWQYLLLAHIFSIKHGVPSGDAMRLLDQVRMENNFKVDRNMPLAESIDDYYRALYRFVSDVFLKRHGSGPRRKFVHGNRAE